MSALITLILNGLSSLLNHLTRSPDEIAAYDPTTEMNVAESSVKMEDGCIILQTETMQKIQNDTNMASQTDTLLKVLVNAMESVVATLTYKISEGYRYEC